MSPGSPLPAHGVWGLIAGRVRARFLALRGARVGKKAWLGANVRVTRARGLALGERVSIEEGARIILVDRSARLELGAFAFVGAGSRFDLIGRLEVGAHALIGPGCFVTDHNHGLNASLRIDQQACVARSVRVGADVWLGAGVMLLPGVEMGDGSVAAAGAVVTESVDPGSIVGGVPARVIGRRGPATMGAS